MATFILRAIDPALWLRVEAKAAADGLTVKAFVLKVLAQAVALVLLVLLASACASHPGMGPTPIPTTAAPAVPAAIALTSVSGFGGSANQIFLIATVKDAAGKLVDGTTVQFSTTAGTFPVDRVLALGGTAQATLTTTGPATVTAAVGSLAGQLDVVPIAPPPGPVVTPPVLVPPPPPAPPPPPPTPQPLPSLSVSLSCTPVAHASPTDCNVTASWGATPLASVDVIQVGWDWGDGHTTATSAPATAYTYPFAGSYTIAAYPMVITPMGTQTIAVTHGVTIP